MAVARHSLSQTDSHLAGPPIADDRRVYTDEEFALILRQAAELAEPGSASSRSSAGLTLHEMKAAAAQAGIDPALVERAARQLASNATAAPSFLERMFGGRARYRGDARFPVALDEAGVARLMSAIRLGVGRPGEGHSSALGLTWHSSDDGGSVLSVTAQTDQESTSVTAELDRRGTLAVVASMTGIGGVMAGLFGGILAGELVPGFEAAGSLVGLGGVLAVARSYWEASTQTARDRLSHVMDSVSRFLTQPDNPTTVEERIAVESMESDPVPDAKRRLGEG